MCGEDGMFENDDEMMIYTSAEPRNYPLCRIVKSYVQHLGATTAQTRVQVSSHNLTNNEMKPKMIRITAVIMCRGKATKRPAA